MCNYTVKIMRNKIVEVLGHENKTDILISNTSSNIFIYKNVFNHINRS